MGEFGIKRRAAAPADPLALLAVYSPGGERTARVVLHARLTFVPRGPSDLSAIRDTFRIDSDILIVTASDLQHVSEMLHLTERADVYAATIASIELACARRDSAAGRVATAELRLHEARSAFDRVVAQRADADAAITGASEQLLALERGTEDELQLGHDLDAAHAAEARVVAELRTARAALHPDDAPDDAALAALAESERARDVRVALSDYCSRLDDAEDPEAVALAARWERAGRAVGPRRPADAGRGRDRGRGRRRDQRAGARRGRTATSARRNCGEHGKGNGRRRRGRPAAQLVRGARGRASSRRPAAVGEQAGRGCIQPVRLVRCRGRAARDTSGIDPITRIRCGRKRRRRAQRVPARPGGVSASARRRAAAS